MAIDSSKLCMGCMSVKNPDGTCPRCRMDGRNPVQKQDLPPRSLLANRYLVGKAYRRNGETISYVGFDQETDRPVTVIEYMPSALCVRREGGTGLTINAGSETNYKTLLSQYDDILKALYKLNGHKGLLPLLNIIHQNNTVYAVFETKHLIPFSSFLERCRDGLPWGQAKQLFLPFFHTVALLHTNNLVHRGISPSTVYIDREGTLWLTGFSTSALRTARSEIDCELFPGYTAPEQYSLSSWQGTWTDVYALGALLYRTLTGSTPPEAQRSREPVPSCRKLNPAIPLQVSQVIEGAMHLSAEKRTQTVARMLAGLQNVTDSPAEEEEEVHLRRGERKKKKKSSSHAFLYTFMTVLIAAGVLGKFALDFMEKYWLTDSELTGSGQSQAVNLGGTNRVLASHEVPKFIGMSLESVQNNAQYTDKYLFSVVREENDNVIEGIIFAQSPEAGTPMQNKGTVILTVSTGSPTVPMPDLTGKPLEEAKRILNNLGVVNVEVMEAYEEGEAEVVLRTNIKTDTIIRKNRDKVILIIPQKSMETEEEEEGRPIDAEDFIEPSAPPVHGD